MALTVSNTNSLTLLNILNRTSQAYSTSMTRLSTGLRINSGKDDPAGLIAMSGMESALTSVNAALANNQRTDAMLGVADNALGQLSSMLNDIQDLAQKSTNAAGLSKKEIAANQAQLDNALAAIDRIIGTTEFNGQKLLDGSIAAHAAAATSDAAKVSDIHVYSRSASQDGTLALAVTVADAASAASVNLATGAATAATTLNVSGKLGSAVVEIASSATLAQIAQAVNDVKAQTGVSASVQGSNVQADGDFGSSAFVRVQVLDGDTTHFTDQYQAGTDAVVSINGQVAAADGKDVMFASNGLNMSFTLSTTGNADAATMTINVEDEGGATFQLGTESSTRQTVGVDALYTQRLGNAELGYLSSLKSGGTNSLLSDPGQAAKIAAAAAQHVAEVQGRLGGFNKFQVQTSLNALAANKEGLTAAKSAIGDVDYAAETANLNRVNTLMQSAMSLLGLANQQGSQILRLLG